MNAEHTAALVGTWDPRVPPTAFWDLEPVARESADAPWAIPDDPATLEINPAIVTQLRGYGLTASDAIAFGQYLFFWQRFADGDIAVADMPVEFVLATTADASGGTRWAFKGAKSPLLPGAPPAVPVSAVEGAPDLLANPFATRFSACVRIATGSPLLSRNSKLRHTPIVVANACDESDAPATASRRAALGAPGAGEAPSALRAAGVPDAEAGVAAVSSVAGAGLEGAASRAAAAAAEALSADAGPRSLPGAEQQAILRSLLVIPFAKVDTVAWAEQEAPEPNLPPQSHWVNARTNPAWRQANGGYLVRGRHHFTSLAQFVAFATVPEAAAAPPPAAASATPSSTPPAAAAASRTPSPTPTPTRSASSAARAASASRTPTPTPTATVSAEASTQDPAPPADTDPESASASSTATAPLSPTATPTPLPTPTPTPSPTRLPGRPPQPAGGYDDDEYLGGDPDSASSTPLPTRTTPSATRTPWSRPSASASPAPPPAASWLPSFSIYTLSPQGLLMLLVVAAALATSAVSVVRAIAARRVRLAGGESGGAAGGGGSALALFRSFKAR